MMNKRAPVLLRLFPLPQKMLRRPPTDLEKKFLGHYAELRTQPDFG